MLQNYVKYLNLPSLLAILTKKVSVILMNWRTFLVFGLQILYLCIVVETQRLAEIQTKNLQFY